MPHTNLFDLAGRVALVTGGNGGIGRSIAIGLAEAGADVAIVGRNQQKNDAILAELKSVGVRSVAIKADVTDTTQVEPAFARAENELGPVNILVNNAGTGLIKPSLEVSLEDWNRVIEINLTACFLLSKVAGLSMVKRKAGKIINIASIYGSFGNPVAASYSASKGALIQLTKSMAIELAPSNIQVNVIAPGYFHTDLTAPFESTPFYEEIIKRTPAGRWGNTSELAGAAVFLASRASDYVTGASLVVDGGYSIS